MMDPSPSKHCQLSAKPDADLEDRPTTPRPSALWSGLQSQAVSSLDTIEFLSSWAIRSSEFSLVLFLASMFQDTLVYISLYNLESSSEGYRLVYARSLELYHLGFVRSTVII